MKTEPCYYQCSKCEAWEGHDHLEDCGFKVYSRAIRWRKDKLVPRGWTQRNTYFHWEGQD